MSCLSIELDVAFAIANNKQIFKAGLIYSYLTRKNEDVNEHEGKSIRN